MVWVCVGVIKMRHEREDGEDSLLGRRCAFSCFFFLLVFFFCVACLPACQIRAGCKVVQEGGRVNCRYTRQGLTNLRVNKLRA